MAAGSRESQAGSDDAGRGLRRARAQAWRVRVGTWRVALLYFNLYCRVTDESRRTIVSRRVKRFLYLLASARVSSPTP